MLTYFCYFQVKIGDWVVVAVDGGHLVVLPELAAARNTLAPAMLVRSDGTLFISNIWSGLDQADDAKLAVTCNASEYYDINILGARVCQPITDCVAGERGMSCVVPV
jgi:hypothetical protein